MDCQFVNVLLFNRFAHSAGPSFGGSGAGARGSWLEGSWVSGCAARGRRCAGGGRGGGRRRGARPGEHPGGGAHSLPACLPASRFFFWFWQWFWQFHSVCPTCREAAGKLQEAARVVERELLSLHFWHFLSFIVSPSIFGNSIVSS